MTEFSTSAWKERIVLSFLVEISYIEPVVKQSVFSFNMTVADPDQIRI